MAYAKVAPLIEEDEVRASSCAQAWMQMCEESGQPVSVPTRVLRLKPKTLHRMRKSEVYRMEGIGDGIAPVVAKRCLRSSAPIERQVYENILPHLPVSSLRYYGYCEESDGQFCWLFVDFAGNTKADSEYAPFIGQWLAEMHTSASAIADSVALPDRGPAYFLHRLRNNHAEVSELLADRRAADDERRVYGEILRQLGRLELMWPRIIDVSEIAPRTLVHGDFVKRNGRIRESGGELSFVALDWETAGWGPPAADLSNWPYPPNQPPMASALDVYATEVKTNWPGVGRNEVEHLSCLGAVFRILSAIAWGCEDSRSGSPKGIKRLRYYAADLDPAIDKLEI